MDSGTAHLSPVPLDRRDVILRGALLSRHAELQKSWKHLVSQPVLDALGQSGTQVASFLSRQDAVPNAPLPKVSTWLECNQEFWQCLLAIALGKKLESGPASVSPPSLSLGIFKELPGPERFSALCSRYRCPLNIALAGELPVAEELLRQLMVVERAKLERAIAIDVDNVLLSLNLVGIRGLVTRDLRSLDALNYFYELAHRSFIRMNPDGRLLASWLCIYAQLLSTPNWLKCK